MSAANQIVPFGTGSGANVMTPAAFAALATRLTGFQSGVASSQQVNTALRQASFVSAVIAQWIADYQGSPVNDDGNIAELEAQFSNALAAYVEALIAGAGSASVLQVVQTQFLITTGVTYTVGSGGQFADLNAALTFISKYLITYSGSVTLSCLAGQTTYTTPVNFNHPNADRITVTGGNLASAISATGTFQCTGSSSGQRTTDAAVNLNNLRSQYATELRFTGGIGGIISQGKQPAFVNLLITGDGAGTQANGANGLSIYGGATISNVSVHGFGGANIIVRQSFVSVASGKAMTASASGSAASGGIDLQTGGFILYAGLVVTSGNGTHGINEVGGQVEQNGGSFISKGNALNGTNIQDGGSHVGTTGCAYTKNGGHGVYVYMGTASVDSADCGGNALYGIYCDTTKVHAASAAFSSSNGSGTMKADNGGYIAAVGAASNGTESPAVNTTGANGQSYIRN